MQNIKAVHILRGLSNYPLFQQVVNVTNFVVTKLGTLRTQYNKFEYFKSTGC